jgi:hypothetical protein
MSNIGTALISILTAIIGVAIIAVLVSKGAQTSQVLTSAGQAFSGILGAAVGPVSGSGISTLGTGLGNLGNLTVTG